jgi:hypothetical protein
MATTGKSAWEKYYQGKGDINTSTKKETDAFDPINLSSTLGIVPAATQVTVKATKVYDAKPLIEFKFGGKVWKCRVKFDDLQKPGIVSKVNSTNVKTLPNKALTPDGLGLGGKKISKAEYIRTVSIAISSCKLAPLPIKNFLQEFLDKSINTTASLSPVVKSISEKDVAIIAKDFGELAGAWWFINNYDKKLSFVEFPVRSNEPLVDYYVGYPNGIKLKVSAKADKGAAPALNSIWETIKSKTFTGGDKKVYDFMSTIVNNNGLESIILASEHYNSTAYGAVAAMIGKKHYTSQDLENWLKEFTDSKALYNILNQKLFSKIKRSVPAANIQKIVDDKGARRCGIILSPMAYSLVDEVNSDKTYKTFLTQACKAMNVEQLYVMIKPNAQSLNYKLKGFKDSEFVFEYHSNAGNPGGNKIGFKMEI